MVLSRAGEFRELGEVLVMGPPVCCLFEKMCVCVSLHFVCVCEHVHVCLFMHTNCTLDSLLPLFPFLFDFLSPANTQDHTQAEIQPSLNSFKQGPPG